MELRHLRYFVTVVEEQSITKAAEKLCIAQPPLSRQIQKLEEELGITLFERGSRPVKATEAGMFFYEHAVQILTHTAQATSMAQRINAVDKTVRIGYVSSLMSYMNSMMLTLTTTCFALVLYIKKKLRDKAKMQLPQILMKQEQHKNR